MLPIKKQRSWALSGLRSCLEKALSAQHPSQDHCSLGLDHLGPAIGLLLMLLPGRALHAHRYLRVTQLPASHSSSCQTHPNHNDQDCLHILIVGRPLPHTLDKPPGFDHVCHDPKGRVLSSSHFLGQKAGVEQVQATPPGAPSCVSLGNARLAFPWSVCLAPGRNCDSDTAQLCA